ncbi:hypothetical protein ACFOGJ_06145 [Marinibaculum pumilum]|uniref:Uncharacterized protein n=1 Tax=Marinibaculum pumilum TaxID=1766165 RepID=A0ABV7KX87_9PROT
MVKALGSGSPWFRVSDKTKMAHNGVFKFDKKTGFRFPTKVTDEKGKFAASAGPFSFKAEESKESSFTWTPLAAELEVGANFGLKVAASAEAVPGVVQIAWNPALLGADGKKIAAVIAALTGTIAGVTAVTSLKSDTKTGDTAVEISSYAALIAAAAALLALQQNMSFKLNLNPTLGITVHPVLVAEKTEGKEWETGAMDNKTTAYKKSINKTDLLVAVGLMKASGSDNDSSASSVNAVANSNGVALNRNKT